MTAYAISRRNAIRCSLAAACALVLPTTLSACSKDAPHKAGMFIDGVIDDGGWGESCYRALVDTAEAHQREHTVTESVSEPDWPQAIEDLIADGCTIVFAPGAQYTETVADAAASHEDVKFIVLNGDFELDNVENLVPNNAQIGQLAGARRALSGTGSGMAVAQPNDAGSAYDQVIAGSIVTDNAMMMRNAFRDIESGSFGNKTVAGDASTGGISVGTLSDVLVEPYVQERYLGIAERIAQGAFIG